MRDAGAGVGCVLDNVTVLAHAAKEQPRHTGRDVSKRQVFHNVTEGSLA